MTIFRLAWLLPTLNPVFYSFFANDFRQRLRSIIRKYKSNRMSNFITKSTKQCDSVRPCGDHDEGGNCQNVKNIDAGLLYVQDTHLMVNMPESPL